MQLRIKPHGAPKFFSQFYSLALDQLHEFTSFDFSPVSPGCTPPLVLMIWRHLVPHSDIPCSHNVQAHFLTLTLISLPLRISLTSTQVSQKCGFNQKIIGNTICCDSDPLTLLIIPLL